MSDGNFNILPKNSKPFGLSYAEWTQKWWQWIISIPKEQNPLNDLTGENSAQSQYGPIWFLAGTTNYNPEVTRNISSSKKTLMFPIYNELRIGSSSSTNDETQRQMGVMIDNKVIENPRDFEIYSGEFDLEFPANNVFDLSPGMKKVSSTGYWIIMSCSTGSHQIKVYVDKGTFLSDVTYFVNIDDPEQYEMIRTIDNNNFVDLVMSVTNQVMFNPEKRYMFDSVMGINNSAKDEIFDIVRTSIPNAELKQLINERKVTNTTITKNVKELLDKASSIAKNEGRLDIEPRDVTNAIIALGIRGSIWPVCE